MRCAPGCIASTASNASHKIDVLALSPVRIVRCATPLSNPRSWCSIRGAKPLFISDVPSSYEVSTRGPVSSSRRGTHRRAILIPCPSSAGRRRLGQLLHHRVITSCYQHRRIRSYTRLSCFVIVYIYYSHYATHMFFFVLSYIELL